MTWGTTLALLSAFVMPVLYRNVAWLRDNSKMFSAPFPGLERGHDRIRETGFAWSWVKIRTAWSVSVQSVIVNQARLDMLAAADVSNPGYVESRLPWWCEPAEEPDLPLGAHPLNSDGIAWNTRYTDEGWGWPRPALALRLAHIETQKTDPGFIQLMSPSTATSATVEVPHLLYGVESLNLINQIGYSLFGADWTQNCAYLPLRPLWDGLVINGVVFGALVGAPWVAPAVFRFVRGKTRSRRELCPACGYSMAGLGSEGKCPECGRERMDARPGVVCPS